MEDKFNYCIGSYREGCNSIGCYAYGREVFYGTIKDAEDFMKYVKKQSPDKQWKIFKLVEVE